MMKVQDGPTDQDGPTVQDIGRPKRKITLTFSSMNRLWPNSWIDNKSEHLTMWEYQIFALTSCAGRIHTSGHKISGVKVATTDRSVDMELPTFTEYNEIPNEKREIPTLEVIKHHRHIKDLPIPPCTHKQIFYYWLANISWKLIMCNLKDLDPRTHPLHKSWN